PLGKIVPAISVAGLKSFVPYLPLLACRDTTYPAQIPCWIICQACAGNDLISGDSLRNRRKKALWKATM
ncbi:hypothetical protein, partial [Pseudomonas syringae]|uniref:hypothetical protein n=1 Tax=Pseudomonas syringae TaxID=317 RepID=UPI001EE694F2